MKTQRNLQRFFGIVLALALMLSCFPAGALIVRAEAEQGLAGKTISILGDSISTFAGVSNDASVNATLKGGAIYYNDGTLGISREDTWWQQTVDALGLRLLVNNSWSGSCVLHTRAGTVGGYVDRCVQLHNDKTGEEPDIIAVFLGTNDFSYYQSALGSADIDYDSLIKENQDGTFTYAVPTTTCEAYAIMLHKMTQRYPGAEVYCMTMLPRRNPVNSGADVGQPTVFNGELTKIINRFGCTAVDLESCGITSEPANFDVYMTDKRVHPGPKGMDQMTKALVQTILGEERTLYQVEFRLNEVVADKITGVAMQGASLKTALTPAAGCEGLKVSVTMGGTDITDTCYKDGVLEIGAVTADVVITASSYRPPESYRWEFNGSDLVSVESELFAENDLTKQAGTTANGILKDTYYSLEKPVVLLHDRPWILELRAAGTWSGMFLSADKGSGTEGNTYIFKSSTNSGLIAFGERVNGQFENYGVPLESLGVDTGKEHVYRLENRIAADGTNMVYLLVDGVDYGPMNRFYIGGTDNKNQTVNWVSGRDLRFSYIGANAHALNNCSIDYMEIWETTDLVKDLALQYDDHYDVTGKTVEILDAGKPTSYQVGYGVEENTVLDTAVVTLEGNYLVATGIGTAKVKINGVIYEITVTAAPLSVFLLMGQSNMAGNDGNKGQSIAVQNGQAYSTFTGNTYLTVETAPYYIPSALTGQYSTVNAAGTVDYLKDNPVNAVVEAGDGKIGMDSAIAYRWNQMTGDKVWTINLAHAGSAIGTWLSGKANYNEALAAYEAVKDTLEKEIAAGHFTLKEFGYFWNQGCADTTRTAQQYAADYIAMHEAFQAAVSLNHDADPETEELHLQFGAIIPIRSGRSYESKYRAGVYDETPSSDYYTNYMDMQMSGPRVAQFWMGNNPELEDIFVVWGMGEDWVYMPDGSDGVAAYFASHYENGRVDYPTQTAQAASWYQPTTPAQIHNSIHFRQMGYNEVGLNAAMNLAYTLGRAEAPKEEMQVTLYSWDGINEVSEVDASFAGESQTLVVPVVTPIYRSKELTYEVSDGLEYAYYDLLADRITTGGTLVIDGADHSVQVNKGQLNNYRWEFDGTELVSVTEGENKENTLKKLSGTTSEGVFSGTQYQMEQSVILMHDEQWSIEWKCAGTWRSDTNSGGMMLIGNYSGGDPYLFKSDNGSLIAFGYKGTSHYNYGIALKDHGIDGSAEHVYRLQNRIAADGTNMVYLYVDGELIGPMNQEYIGTNASGITSDWLSGKDIVFSYIGNSGGFSLNNCSIDYIAVQESSETAETLELKYDDYYEVTGKTVEILDAGKPTSYQVGYGVEENTVLDTAVVTLEGNYLIATGIGTAKVKIDGTLYEVIVESAPISLLLLIGQSNMQGSEGDENQSIVCPDGMVYTTYGDRYTMTTSNATNFVPSALTGAGSAVNVNGTTANLAEWPIYLLNEAGVGKKGPDSGFAYEWVQQTGEKVWVVNAAHGGTSISVWQPGTQEYEECQALFTACTETLRKEIAAGHFTLNHMLYFWCQGCTDRGRTAQWYVERYLAMHESFKTELAFDHDSDPTTADKTFEMGGMIPVRVGSTTACYRDGVYETENPYAYHESYVDLRFSGPRVAQYWMANNPELTDIWNVCTIGEDWVWMPDGTNGVTEYFQKHYENGTVDYTPQVAQKASWYTPTTPKAVHDSIHYNQIGYNEIGRESVRNAMILLGEKEDYTEPTTVEFLNWTGYQQADEITASKSAHSGTLVVPMVSPITRSKSVTYELSDGLSWNYYDLTATNAGITGTLQVAGADNRVSVIKATPGAHYADHLSQLPEVYCAGTNLWSVLEHDPYYYASGTNWGIYSGGQVCSVTIPVEPGDKIFATSFGKAGTNGHASSSGIRVTFFSEYGVAKTMNPAETYAEFNKNGGYLIVPEGAVAFNIPMWNNSDDNELYILNAGHSVAGLTCVVCGQLRSDLAGHLQQLPENYCADTNLWTALEPENDYYSGTEWVGKYYSVTFPLQAGEKLIANSFGKAGTNGHNATNGIQVTFFTEDGGVIVLLPAETYAEFTTNGYVTAPAGTVAVNVGQWTDTVEGEIYILTAEHVQTHLPGDINGDGTVNNKDAMLLFQYLSGWKVEIVEEALDVNGDGTVNNKDATRLFQYVSGWKVEIF